MHGFVCTKVHVPASIYVGFQGYMNYLNENTVAKLGFQIGNNQ